ncbi:MAG TPA: DUF2723 domain-containing protein [Vicinamibacterales bacterium]|nr:DUF2723 domain-containing protein [Vicinamibacterales bacterium]
MKARSALTSARRAIRTGLTSDVLLGLAVAAGSLALFAATLQPDFGGPEDTPKFQFIGYVLGIPHPPGYPLYVLLSHVFTAIPIGTIAYRANLFSAVMAAIACALAYAIARQLGATRWTAACAAMGLATGASFWRSAVFAEVYSLAAVMAGLVITLLLAWGARGRSGWLVAAFGAFAFGLGNHLTIVGVVPAFAAYALTRGYRIWSIRTVGACAVLLALGAGQYGLIVARTRQEAPYVEVRATSASDLLGVVTAERFADQRFAFGPAVLLTEHLPAVSALIAREFGAAGTIGFAIGAIGIVRSANAALVLGAAAGMLAMVVNISGDLKGFITPVMVLLWPFAAVGANAAAGYVRSIRRAGSVAAAAVLGLAALMPLANLAANYDAADQSQHTADGRFLRTVLRQLPERAAVVAEDYWSDMAWRYYHLTGEAGPDRGIVRVDFSADSARNAAREGRRVFALATGATFLAAEGLTFTRAAIEGPPLAEWLRSLPRRSVVVGAVAYAPSPVDMSAIGHSRARPQGRDRAFEAFAAVVHSAGDAWRREDDEVSLTVDAQSLRAPLPPLAGPLVAAAARGGARIDLAERTIARVESGAVVAAFAPDGTLLRALEFGSDEPRRVDYEGAIYELTAESPCAELKPDAWVDLTPVFATGSWVATLHAPGSIVIETVTPGSRDVRARSAVLLGDGTITTEVTHRSEGDVLTTRVARTGDRRPLFRLALDRRLPAVRARVRAAGAPSAIRVCALNPMRALFPPGRAAAVLNANFESEAYFGAGWSDAIRTPAGPVRRAENAATLFLPLAPGRDHRLVLEIAPGIRGIEVALDDQPLGLCTPLPRGCEIILPSGAIQNGVSALTLAARSGADSRSVPLTLFAARISRAR